MPEYWEILICQEKWLVFHFDHHGTPTMLTPLWLLNHIHLELDFTKFLC